MRAAADALAMRVEQHDLDAAQPVPGQRLGEAQLEPLDQVARRQLAEVAAGVRVAELQAEPADAAQIGPVMRRAQRLFENARPVLERVAGLEQRADLDVPLHPAEPGEPERGEQRVAAAGLGDEEADRRVPVHVLGDLRHQHHQPQRRGLLGHQGAEIDRDRLDRASASSIAASMERRRERSAGGSSRPRRRRTALCTWVGVEPRVRMGEAQPVRDHAGAGDAERELPVRRRVGDGGGEEREQRLGREQRAVAAADEAAGEGADVAGSGPAGASSSWAATSSSASADPVLQLAGALHLAGNRCEAELLHAQPQAQAVPPADIGPPIGVEADPGGEHDRAWVERGPGRRARSGAPSSRMAPQSASSASRPLAIAALAAVNSSSSVGLVGRCEAAAGGGPSPLAAAASAA